MAEFLFDMTPRMPEYVDRRALLRSKDETSFAAQRQQQLEVSCTVYVGGLAYYTTEQQVLAHFQSVGAVLNVIMGLNRIDRTPAGFCFVQYYNSSAALAAVNTLNQSVLDDRRIRVDWDVGNVRATNRFWTRGAQGLQASENYRQNVDLGRGGLGGLRSTDDAERSVLENQMVKYEWTAPPQAKRKPAVKKSYRP